MKRVPLIKPDLPPFEAVSDSFKEILGNGKVTNFGKYATRFEQATGDYLGVSTALVTSGTIGLVLALQACGVASGQKVITPSFGFMATAQAILYAGGIPVFADIGEDLALSPTDLEFLLSHQPDVAFVVPLHPYGSPCPVEEIQAVVDAFSSHREKEIHLVYDAAHAFGAKRSNRHVGTFGEAEVFSFSVTKVLVCAEGGLVASRDERLIQRVKKMRNYGIEEGYDAHWPGLNGKMSEFHAILGLENLKRLEELLSIRAHKAALYSKKILEKTCFQVLLPSPEVRHTFKDFSILVPSEMKERRNTIANFLQEQGIETRTYFCPPLHEQKFFRRFSDRPLPVTEDISRRVITLPFFSAMTEEEMEWVVEGLRRA